MSLPPRVSEKATPAKRPKREARWRSDAHRDWIRRFACANCGERANVEPAHVRLGSHTGLSRKPDDWRCVPLCGHQQDKDGCHARQHQIGERTFWDEYRATHRQTVEQLIDALCDASPKAHEIRQIRREREAA